MTDKKFNELSPEEMKDLKIEFAPGCFDNFEGTQEELDGLIEEIKRMFVSGEAQLKSVPLDLDDLDDEEIEILENLSEQNDRVSKRTLQ